MRRIMLCLLMSMLLMPIATTLAKEQLSPTTGLPTDSPYRPVMVILSNAPEGGRQALRLSQADIVYETIIWGPGHTRYAAIFNDQHPDSVGSIRSARAYHGFLRDEWDCPLVFWNGDNNSHVFHSIWEHFNIMGTPDAFVFSGARSGQTLEGILFRRQNYASPNNSAANLRKLVDEHWPASKDAETAPHEPQLPALSFSDKPSRGDIDVTTIHVEYDEANYTATYEYDAETGTYARLYNGYRMIDEGTGDAIYADNIIVQFCETSYVNNMMDMPVINFIGQGTFHAFIEGTKIEGKWSKDSPESPTLFTYREKYEDTPLTLRPGKTFIQVFPLGGRTIDETKTEPTIRYMRPEMPIKR